MLETILDTNKDWNIELEHKDGQRITICNYYAAGGNDGSVAKNYPYGEGSWISRQELIDNYTFISSWTHEENFLTNE